VAQVWDHDRRGGKYDLGYSDTDSLVVYVETEDIHGYFEDLTEYMDFSDYPKNHPTYDATNKKFQANLKMR